MITKLTGNPAHRMPFILFCVTAVNCVFQIGWFWRFRAHNVTMDGVNYIGLARHLRDGDFIASLHGYWSPLLSWLIAGGSFFTRDLTVLARIITIASFLLCLPLLYRLTMSLWHSPLAAAVAALWFSLARAVLAGAMATIQADFLLTAATLVYFTILVACLREDRDRNWLLLGIAHAVAFLAKAFAMPWLAITTVLAIASKPSQTLRGRMAAFTLAMLAPAVVWFAWGEALKTKYAVFTTGFQLRANLMVDLTRKLNHREKGDPYPLVDAAYDKYMVTQPSFASLQAFKIANPVLLPMIVQNELHNVPAALKEIIVLLTPGGVIALIGGAYLLLRHRRSYPSEAAYTTIALASLASLVCAYGMLVFDGRYVLPITPVLIAIAARFIVPARMDAHPELRPASALPTISLALLVTSMIALALYPASPYRAIDRDFQRSCYDAASKLSRLHLKGDRIVSIGDGPYPERGIGFEVGIYVAYHSGRRLIAMNSALPAPNQSDELAKAVLSKNADIVLVWGKPSDPAYREIVAKLALPAASNEPIDDPVMGEVGRLLAFPQP